MSEIENIPANSKCRAASIHRERDPPRALFVKFLIKVFKHQKPHGEPR